MLKKIILMIGSPALSIYLTSLIMDGMHIGSLTGVLIVSIFLGVLNMTVKPIIKLFALPITFLSLGLFNFVINGFTLLIAFRLAPDVYISGLGSAIIASCIISVINVFLDTILD